jgi:serine/threonine protein kinase/Tol biopolymer transport system component
MSMIGKSLVHYEISAEIGKGGMGEVYQAKDTKLGRDVAIKVLPEEFAMDHDRVARFQREAKLLASLNHPNITAIHGLEESEGIHFLVMELIEGDMLRDRIKSGPIPVEEALKLALQMAEALEAAHEKGVIHRDLKPANIKVTPDGKVKILDFGLAKAYVGDQENVSPMDSPTISAAATQQGVILGTAAYMSPEQAKGKSVDKRADIWAFGVVLFEMLTGRQLFTGETASETLASVMKSEPEWNNLPLNLHSRIRLLLERCLKKDPRNRYSGISDARVDIQEVLADPDGVLAETTVAVKFGAKSRIYILWTAATIVLIFIATLAVWKLKSPEHHQVTRFVHDLKEDQQLEYQPYPDLAVSPDGRQFAYGTSSGLFLRSLGELDARRISGANEITSTPFFSPDGQWIGYWSQTDTKLKKVAITGGAPVVLCDGGTVLGANWGADDMIVYSQNGKGIMRISAAGGIPEMLIEIKDEAFYHPRLLPDGKSVIFTIGPPPYRIAVQSLKSRERKVLFAGDTAWYLPTGHVVYALENDLLAVPFDLDRLKAIGGPVPIIEGVYRADPLTAPQYAVSNSGTLVYMPGTPGAAATPAQRILVWVDRQGREEPLAAAAKAYHNPRVSPDGTKVALTVSTNTNRDIWIWDLARENLDRLTVDPSLSAYPLWSLDGKRIAYTNRKEGYILCWKAADGTGKTEPLGSAPSGTEIIPASWSSDGKTLVQMELTIPPNYNFDIAALSMEGDPVRKPLLHEKYSEAEPQISPDGRWLAYASNESGRYEVYVRPFPEVDSGGRWLVSTGGGNSPLWSRDGRELYYRNGDAVMAVPVKTGPGFSIEAPELLFHGRYVSAGFVVSTLELNPWDISPDGMRFLMMKELRTAASELGGPRKITVVLNWVEELKERVPVD